MSENCLINSYGVAILNFLDLFRIPKHTDYNLLIRHEFYNNRQALSMVQRRRCSTAMIPLQQRATLGTKLRLNQSLVVSSPWPSSLGLQLRRAWSQKEPLFVVRVVVDSDSATLGAQLEAECSHAGRTDNLALGWRLKQQKKEPFPYAWVSRAAQPVTDNVALEWLANQGSKALSSLTSNEGTVNRELESRNKRIPHIDIMPVDANVAYSLEGTLSVTDN